MSSFPTQADDNYRALYVPRIRQPLASDLALSLRDCLHADEVCTAVIDAESIDSAAIDGRSPLKPELQADIDVINKAAHLMRALIEPMRKHQAIEAELRREIAVNEDRIQAVLRQLQTAREETLIFQQLYREAEQKLDVLTQTISVAFGGLPCAAADVDLVERVS